MSRREKAEAALRTLSQQEKNERIMQHLGIVQCDPASYGSDNLFHWKGHGYILRIDLPDFFRNTGARKDLLAAIPAKGNFKRIYWIMLESLIFESLPKWPESDWESVRALATADLPMYAEAFGITAKLWKKGQ